jgi:serine-type D-Ala-D-Ala carboxypeptidase/endopeptidase
MLTQMLKRTHLGSAVAFALMAFAVPAAAQGVEWRLPANEDIRKLIAERNAPRPGQGIVIGVLENDSVRIVAGGTGAAAAVDANTLFEIGSITKVFTALLLADMANKREVSLDDPAAKYLPAGQRVPERNGRPITLRDLATHRSGLPRMADDMQAVYHRDGPFADYDEKRLLSFLDRHELARDAGSQWEYSNLGVGLLGYLLGRAAGSDYETLLRTRITGPLGMNNTALTLSPGNVGRLAAPFDAYMRPVKRWDPAILVGAYGIRSSAADMLIFARAAMNPTSPIAAAMKTVLAVRTPIQGARGVDQALGWPVRTVRADREILLHDGQTAGFRSMLMLEPAAGKAVVALSNSAASPDVVDLAQHVFVGSRVAPTPAVPPPPPTPVARTEISMPVAELDKLVGRYAFDAGFVISITRHGGFLYVVREDAPLTSRSQILPEAALSFFWKAMDAQIRFTTDASGVVTGAVMIADGQQFRAKRVAR